jgi:hypothetical protein
MDYFVRAIEGNSLDWPSNKMHFTDQISKTW